jgi:RNA polymerase sigma-70 factor (ECF subfamily)
VEPEVIAERPSFDAFAAGQRAATLALLVAVAGPDAEDLVQEALARAHERWDVVAGYDRPDLWLHRVALNLAASRRRRWSSELRAIARLGGRRSSTYVRLTAPSAEVWDAVRALPRRQAEVVALRYVEDLDVDEIAEVLEIEPPTVRVHLHRARLALAAALDADAGSDEQEEPQW